jgi:hypothetical protein
VRLLEVLRRVPIEQLLMHPQLIPKKYFTNKAIATHLERAIKVASGAAEA